MKKILTRAEKRVRKQFSEMGKIGGRARAKKLSKKRRREIAIHAINARWAKKRTTAKGAKTT